MVLCLGVWWSIEWYRQSSIYAHRISTTIPHTRKHANPLPPDLTQSPRFAHTTHNDTLTHNAQHTDTQTTQLRRFATHNHLSTTFEIDNNSLLEKIRIFFFSVRLQADGHLKQPRYKGAIDAFMKIANRHGFRKFWTGLIPAIQRSMLNVGSTIAAYDHTKQILVCSYNFQDTFLTHFIASSVSGKFTA